MVISPVPVCCGQKQWNMAGLPAVTRGSFVFPPVMDSDVDRVFRAAVGGTSGRRVVRRQHRGGLFPACCGDHTSLLADFAAAAANKSEPHSSRDGISHPRIFDDIYREVVCADCSDRSVARRSKLVPRRYVVGGGRLL